MILDKSIKSEHFKNMVEILFFKCKKKYNFSKLQFLELYFSLLLDFDFIIDLGYNTLLNILNHEICIN